MHPHCKRTKPCSKGSCAQQAKHQTVCRGTALTKDNCCNGTLSVGSSTATLSRSSQGDSLAVHIWWHPLRVLLGVQQRSMDIVDIKKEYISKI